MTIADFVLKTRVHVALMRDPRVGSLDISVRAEEGTVTLTGDMDSREECDAALEIARRVEGVLNVQNELTCGIGRNADTAEHLTQKLMQKLEDEWKGLPNQKALTQADYLRWALWVVSKFRMPESIPEAERQPLEEDAREQALVQIAEYLNAPKVWAAMEMQRLVQEVEQSPHLEAPEIDRAPLVATPVVAGSAEAA